jgi:hypothetical protein
MQRTIPLLVIILAVQLGLAALLAVRKNPLASTTPQTPLIGADVENADHVVIEGTLAAGASAGSARVELSKDNGKWVLPKYFNAPADKFKLNSVLDELAGLKRGLPIATSSAALKRFKLADDDFERRMVLSRGGKTLGTVYFGSSGGVRQTDARTAKDHAVYTVDLATYELPTQDSDWLDVDLLQRDPTSLTELDVTGATSQPVLKLLRQKAAAPAASAPTPAPASASAPASAPVTAAASAAVWVDGSLPVGKQVDSAHADTLAQDVSELRVSAILGLQDQPEWQQQHPVLTLGITDSKQPGQMATWTISKPSSGNYYVLKDSTQPYYFQIASATGTELIDASAPAQLLASDAGQHPTQPAAKISTKKSPRKGRTVRANKAAT